MISSVTSWISPDSRTSAFKSSEEVRAVTDLDLSRADWRAFTDGVKYGEFDNM